MKSNTASLNYLSSSTAKQVASSAFYMINEQGQEVKITQQMIDGAYRALRQCRYLPHLLSR